MKSYERALEQRGYTPLISIGFRKRADGVQTIKLAASPVVRQFSPADWEKIRETIIGALDRLVESPLDDLEFE